jgi:hypothetical protein
MPLDLTNQDDARKLLETSKNHYEWKEKVDQIQKANGGNLPAWWNLYITQSGFAQTVAATWVNEIPLRYPQTGEMKTP